MLRPRLLEGRLQVPLEAIKETTGVAAHQARGLPEQDAGLGTAPIFQKRLDNLATEWDNAASMLLYMHGL